jgi:GNAT superfamily N-acetyltransferase
VSVRRLRPDEFELLRTIRLRGLRDAPTAFGSTYEREHAFTTDVWQRRLHPDANPHYVFETDDGTVVGIAAMAPDDDGDPLVADVVGMWVDPVARGTGVADALILQVIGLADDEHVAMLKLHYTEGNIAAERLYLRHGFEPTGTIFVRERDGMREIEMARNARAATKP